MDPEKEAAIATAKVVKRGWMNKQGGRIKTWKARFFVLTTQYLAYLENETTHTPKGHILLTDIKGVVEIGQMDGLFHFRVCTDERDYVMRHADEGEARKWMTTIMDVKTGDYMKRREERHRKKKREAQLREQQKREQKREAKQRKGGHRIERPPSDGSEDEVATPVIPPAAPRRVKPPAQRLPVAPGPPRPHTMAYMAPSMAPMGSAQQRASYMSPPAFGQRPQMPSRIVPGPSHMPPPSSHPPSSMPRTTSSAEASKMVDAYMEELGLASDQPDTIVADPFDGESPFS